MSILSQLLGSSKDFAEILRFSHRKAVKLQQKTLVKMLFKARDTAFGKKYGFDDILISKNPGEEFAKRVPLHNYSSMFPWWQRAYNGEADVAWPGKVTYFALSSGTSEGASKYIPVTTDMKKAITRASGRQMLSIVKTDIPKDYLTKHYLMIGGSTDLNIQGKIQSGDLSGILAQDLPFWFEPYTKPSDAIKRQRNWNDKIEKITDEAAQWDVVMISGVPAWIKLLFESIIKRYNLKTIHDIWPNFMVYLHGGVALDPYKESLDALMGKPIMYFETYLASEGFLAYQARLNAGGMRLVFKNNMYYEFLPFNEANFNENGDPNPDVSLIGLDEVEEGKEYAIFITTCSGAWRYLIGDTIKFTNLELCEIKITGRTKHFLSMVGEHLSVDNMNSAISMVAKEMNTQFNEFTVKGVPFEGFFAHKWYISCDDPNIDPEKVRAKLDEAINELNDDYKVERQHALKNIFVELVPSKTFISWMEKQGRLGSQNKFPRVLTDVLYEDWKEFIHQTSSQTQT